MTDEEREQVVREGRLRAGGGDEHAPRIVIMEGEMSKQAMVWVTTHALTKGVMQVQVTIEDRGYAYSTGQYQTQYPPGTWHLTQAGALEKAEEMRVAKIAALERQMAKLRKLDFKGST